MDNSDSTKSARKFVIIDQQLQAASGNKQQITTASALSRVEDDTENSPSADRSSPSLFNKKELEKRRIIYFGMEDSDVLNAFRGIRTSILPKLVQYNSSILVSAVSARGGASFTAVNLAVAFTLDKRKKALLIDCNFNRPSLAANLGVEGDHGLFDYFAGRETNYRNLIYPTSISNIDLIPCGNVDAGDLVEFFTSEKMESLLQSVKQNFPDHLVILDAPPVLNSADTKILSRLCDHVLLVLPYQGADKSRMQKTIREFDEDKIVGVVMNN